MARTLYDKIWDDHLVTTDKNSDDLPLIYVDRHLVHEVTSAQAFEALELSGLKVRHPEMALAVADHNVPTTDRSAGITDPESREQIETLAKNTEKTGITYFGMNDKRQGIVHVVGPEQGFTLPGLVIVCGDSHTSTHGAFGALAHGIGTSEVAHVLATQTLQQAKSKNMRVVVEGKLHPAVSAKDIALAIIEKVGTAGGTGHVMEYTGSAIRSLSMEGRMTLCNMSIEAGAKAGLVAPDETTFAYLKDRPYSPKGESFEQAVSYWKTLYSDADAVFDKEVILKAEDIVPCVTWGTSPEQVLPITASVPAPADFSDPEKAAAVKRALDYMGIEAGQKLTDIKIDWVFIGSCTNARIEDMRSAANILQNYEARFGKKPFIASGVKAMVVPGSGLVKQQAEEEGLDKIFIDAGFEWREPGCSMCLAMNADRLQEGERCASTSNRNFEGRQGRGGRTHLLSPAMAAAAALKGTLADVRDFMGE